MCGRQVAGSGWQKTISDKLRFTWTAASGGGGGGCPCLYYVQSGLAVGMARLCRAWMGPHPHWSLDMRFWAVQGPMGMMHYPSQAV